MRHFEKKNSKNFYADWPRQNVSPGPPVALDGPDDKRLVPRSTSTV